MTFPAMNTKALIVKVKISKLGQSEKDDELTRRDPRHSRHGRRRRPLHQSPLSARRLQGRASPSRARSAATTAASKASGSSSARSAGSVPGPYVEEYRAKITEFEAEFYPAVDRIYHRWPEIIATCRATQGDKFNLDDYPLQVRVREHFGFRLIISPMPKPSAIGDLDFLCGERIEEIQAQMQGEHRARRPRRRTAGDGARADLRGPHLDDALASPTRPSTTS